MNDIFSTAQAAADDYLTSIKAANVSMEEEQKASWEKITIEEHMELYENKGHSRKEAMKLVANDRGMTKRDVYQYLINNSDK